jgi:mevalonate kinase|tara:strand:+ start:740 stop:916 length:177 start_codon:yes stop_codon:yes gene_type:complete
MNNSDTEQNYGLPASASISINTINSTKYYFVSKGGFEGLSKARGIATSVTLGMVDVVT